MAPELRHPVPGEERQRPGLSVPGSGQPGGRAGVPATQPGPGGLFLPLRLRGRRQQRPEHGLATKSGRVDAHRGVGELCGRVVLPGRPVREVATAIEEQDIKSLSGLPGIGPATAERIVAKLRRKVPKFALLATRDEAKSTTMELDVVSEGFSVLVSLGHSEKDARRLIDAALEKNKKYADVQDLLQAVYDQGRPA